MRSDMAAALGDNSALCTVEASNFEYGYGA